MQLYVDTDRDKAIPIAKPLQRGRDVHFGIGHRWLDAVLVSENVKCPDSGGDDSCDLDDIAHDCDGMRTSGVAQVLPTAEKHGGSVPVSGTEPLGMDIVMLHRGRRDDISAGDVRREIRRALVHVDGERFCEQRGDRRSLHRRCRASVDDAGERVGDAA